MSALKTPNGVVVKVGDIIALDMDAGPITVEHVAIYVGVLEGRHRMVHNFNGVGVVMLSVEDFMAGENWWVRNVRNDRIAKPGDEVARRARSKIGENSYNFIYNNCEHFANWCKYGEKFSEQADGVGKVPVVGPLLGLFSGCKEKKGK